MSALEELSALIGLLYDAALAPHLWPMALKAACQYLDAADAMLFSQDAARQARFHFHWNDNEEYTRLFFEEYARINPITPLLALTQVGSVYAASRLMPYEELRASQFFKAWVRPQDRVDFVATTLDKSAGSIALASFGRSGAQGLVDDETLRRMELIAPHLRRAVLVGRVIEQESAEVAVLSDALDGLASGVFLVDARGAVVYANAAGRALLEPGDLLLSAHGVLNAIDPEADRSLRDVYAAAGNGDASVATKGIAIPLATGAGERYLAHVLPLTSGARRAAGLHYSAVAAVFVHKAALDLPTPLEAVATLYRLSSSELRVLHAVVEGGGIPAMAGMLGISEATVKTHLQHLFEKTGTSRQIDLVKIVAAHAVPRAGI